MFAFLWVFLSMFLLTSPGLAAGRSKVLLVAIGGNSECMGLKGTKLLLEDHDLEKAIGQATGSPPAAIDTHYFSWTGDPKGHPGCITGNPDWIRGGAATIQRQLSATLNRRPDQKIVIAGWSNGGATAYELACQLSRVQRGRVSLLITLDPAAWTTQPCVSDPTKSMALAPARYWVSVYTASEGLQKFEASNLIALFGRAWDADFPKAPAVRPNPLYRLKPASHGDVKLMWAECIIRRGALRPWATAEFGSPGRLPPARMSHTCK